MLEDLAALSLVPSIFFLFVQIEKKLRSQRFSAPENATDALVVPRLILRYYFLNCALILLLFLSPIRTFINQKMSQIKKKTSKNKLFNSQRTLM